jgi:hypothetical protein
MTDSKPRDAVKQQLRRPPWPLNWLDDYLAAGDDKRWNRTMSVYFPVGFLLIMVVSALLGYLGYLLFPNLHAFTFGLLVWIGVIVGLLIQFYRGDADNIYWEINNRNIYWEINNRKQKREQDKN